MSEGDYLVRQLADRDWDVVVELEHDAYAADGLSEGREALMSRAVASPTTCFVLERDGAVCGYLLSLPYPLLQCPDLSRVEETVFTSENLHVHDVVIAKELRSQNLAEVLMVEFRSKADELGYQSLSMVAVRGSEILARLLGFRSNREVALPASYGRRAVYMSMPLH
ncbi:GNAT family N-acetyltransferase [Kitasatospora sp. NPDC096147]|uniref:GNAT family N-acetyltransferase n=1 Tax=Kitasatospora sp. NPDC096147 TaxID=3364093 RepID=UPI00382FBFFA